MILSKTGYAATLSIPNHKNLKMPLLKRLIKFTIIIEPCEEGGYFGMCPAFPGCHVEGGTYEETISEMRKAIEAFVKDYLEEKEPLPEDEVTITSLKVAV